VVSANFGFAYRGNNSFALEATITGPGVGSNSALLVGLSDGLHMLMQRFDSAPATTDGSDIDGFESISVDNAGDLLALDTLHGPQVTSLSQFAMYSSTLLSAPQLMMRGGDQAPDLPAGVLVSVPDLPLPKVRNDQFAIQIPLTGTGVTNANDIAIYAGPVTNLHLLAREGDAANVAGPGVTFQTLGTPHNNSSGEVVFNATFSGTGITTSNSQAIIASIAGSQTIVARSGDPAPGLPGETLTGASLIDVNASGNVAFTAGLRSGAGTVSGAIYAGPPSSPQVIEMSGMPAPGAPSGAVFGSPLGNTYYDDRGDVCFLDDVIYPDTTSHSSLYLYIPGQGDLFVARVGDMFDTGGGVMKQVSTIDLETSGFGYATDAFSDDGLLVFTLKFTDNSTQVFAVQAPEPSAVAITLLCIASCARRRRVR
jgi:hypothetical protein